MRSRIAALIAGLAVMIAFNAFAQAATPVTDGKVSPSEYANSHTDGDMTIYWTITDNTIYMAASAPTTGWVAVGLGSSRMNGATIFMGYIDESGKPMVTLQKGRFHSHSPFSDLSPISEVVGSRGGDTVLEIAVRRSDIVSAGAQTLDYIYAYGRTKDFRTRHVFRDASVLRL